MARFTFKKWFERFKPDEETTTILINGYTQINDPIYENDQIYPQSMNYYLIGAAVDKLAAFEDLEEQGRLLQLPCKPGDIVYIFLAKLSVFKFEVIDFVYDKKKRLIMRAEQPGKRGRRYQFFYDDYGKILFFTKEEAEAELIKRQEGKKCD